MKTNKIIISAMSLFCCLFLISCDDDDDNNPSPTINFSGTYVQADQMARPAINTVFIGAGAPKDAFNAAIPSAMGTAYQSIFQNRLMALNPGYTTNALGQTAAQFTGLLATDVLNVSKTAPTTFVS